MQNIFFLFFGAGLFKKIYHHLNVIMYIFFLSHDIKEPKMNINEEQMVGTK